MMEETERQKLVGAVLLTLGLGLFAVAIMGWGAGLISAGLIAVALIVAENL